MRSFLFCLSLLCVLAAQTPPAAKPDKDAMRRQVAEMKVKAFEIQTQIELIEKQLHDIEEAEASQPLTTNLKQAAARIRCGGHTKDGARCTRMTEGSSRFCWQHRQRR